MLQTVTRDIITFAVLCPPFAVSTTSCFPSYLSHQHFSVKPKSYNSLHLTILGKYSANSEVFVTSVCFLSVADDYLHNDFKIEFITHTAINLKIAWKIARGHPIKCVELCVCTGDIAYWDTLQSKLLPGQEVHCDHSSEKTAH